ncbi:hypothetical protein [Planctomyces sp. SH-PL62]|uniref:hypothetical protein n=1 Tax=Planctomyces sp. SH-PL62 TaxID=1636152 RepID=UPI00078E708E|nr:hypothetical protein [Planctomyces sp. SH-PL62]AMV38056.1 hypothetical protein VT85_11505 [Planctomyces sp. SH-PL62]
MRIIHAKALGIGAAALLACGIGGGASAQAQGVVQNPTAVRLNAISNLISGQPTTYPGYSQPYQQAAPNAYSPTSGRWVTQQPAYTYTQNGYVQPQAVYPTQYAQPTANGYVQPQAVYPTQYQQYNRAYNGYAPTQPGVVYRQPTTASRYVDAVRSVVQPQQYQYVTPGYAPQAAPRYVIPR